MQQLKDEWKNIITLPVFLKPEKLPPSAWTEHVPFSFWLLNAAKPSTFVELGTYYGLSYFSFCQGVSTLSIDTKCYAIDNWKGDEHAGYYDNSVFEYVKKENEKYVEFSTLIRSSFNEAVELFEDGSIDLLHIDGFHTYEAVRFDFYNWLPKLSDRAIVIFHDTNVTDKGFGVYRFWDELKLQFPSFEFKHGFGLGILGVGGSLPVDVLPLFKFDSQDEIAAAVRLVYERLGGLAAIEQLSYHVSGNADRTHEGIKNEPIPDGQDHAKSSLPAQEGLQPLSVINAQLFWTFSGEEFEENNSFLQQFDLTEVPLEQVLIVPQSNQAVTRLRIDPTNRQGIFYLHSICIKDESGNAIMEWEEIRGNCLITNLVFFKSSIIEGAFLVFSMAEDPIIEVSLPSASENGFAKSLHVFLSISSHPANILNRELEIITQCELQSVAANSRIYINNSLEILNTSKRYLKELLSGNNRALLGALQQQLELRLNSQSSEINSLNFTIQELANDLRKETGLLQQQLAGKENKIQVYEDQLKLAATQRESLNQELRYVTDNSASLKESMEKLKNEMKEKGDKLEKEIARIQKIKQENEDVMKGHVLALKNEKLELEKKVEATVDQLKISLDEVAIKEQQVLSLNRKIAELENVSILQFLKSRIIKSTK